jgi:hypothetical protein
MKYVTEGVKYILLYSLKEFCCTRIELTVTVDRKLSSKIRMVYLNISVQSISSGTYSVSNRNENEKQKQMFVESKARPVSEAYLPAICEPIV